MTRLLLLGALSTFVLATTASAQSPSSAGFLASRKSTTTTVRPVSFGMRQSLLGSLSGGCGCAAPGCESRPVCGCEPTCAAPPRCGCEPTCATPPSCGCESGCATKCCRKKCVPFKSLLGDVDHFMNKIFVCHSRGCAKSGCDDCAAPACGCEAPACGCEAPPACGCEAPPACGCEAPPSCGCDAPSCGCDTPSCGCAAPPAPFHTLPPIPRPKNTNDPFLDDEDVPPAPPQPARSQAMASPERQARRVASTNDYFATQVRKGRGADSVHVASTPAPIVSAESIRQASARSVLTNRPRQLSITEAAPLRPTDAPAAPKIEAAIRPIADSAPATFVIPANPLRP